MQAGRRAAGSRLRTALQPGTATLQPSAFERRTRARSPRAFSPRATLRAQEARGAVRVYCRLRPLRPTETGPAAAVAEHDAHRLPSKVLLRCASAAGGSDEERCFEFDRVFGSEASTEQVFDDRMQSVGGSPVAREPQSAHASAYSAVRSRRASEMLAARGERGGCAGVASAAREAMSATQNMV